MSKKKINFHGSDLERVEEVFGIKKEDIVSFSSNVNPLGISDKLKETLGEHIDVITKYPDRKYGALRKSIGTYAGASPDHIVVGNGSTELISLFLQISKPKKAIILGPTYSEYEREITLGGGSYSYFLLKEENDFNLPLEELTSKLEDGVDLLMMCNPNNPTSTSINESVMDDLLETCKRLGVRLIVDETYVEFTNVEDGISCIPFVEKYKNLIVLRGISKFFAAPGLRLGYAVTSDKELIESVNETKNPWSINSLADVGGSIMFSDTDFIHKTKKFIKDERNRVVKRLEDIKHLKVYAPTANFILIKILKSGVTSNDIFTQCISKGLMIRDCSSFESLGENFIRFCLQMPDENNRLLDTLESVLG